MTTIALIQEMKRLPLTEKLLVIEETLKSIRTEKERSLRKAVDALYEDYRTDKELTAFIQLDAEDFYAAR